MKRSASPDSLLARLKRAFRWHWHLLGLAAAAGAALLSGDPGMWLPVVAAGEVAYMGMLGLNPRFQAILKLGERPGKPAAAADPWLRDHPPAFRWGGRSMIEEQGEIFPSLDDFRDSLHALVIGAGAAALVLLIATRGRLGMVSPATGGGAADRTRYPLGQPAR